MKEMSLLRVRGKIGTVDEPTMPKINGKFVWCMWVGLRTDDGNVDPWVTVKSNELDPSCGVKKYFDTEEECALSMEANAVKMTKILNEMNGGKGDEGFYDLKDGGKMKQAFRTLQ